jgi:hypothetical protein
MKSAAFYEVQGFRRWFAWAAVGAVNIIFLYAIIRQVIFGIPFGPEPATNLILFLMEFVALSLLYFLFSIRLKTSIDDAGIHYRFYPFQNKITTIEWNELSDVYMREYNSYYEFGGWGIRVGSHKTTRAINTSESCNVGLQLEFKDGNFLMIGTKRPEEIKQIIEYQISLGKVRWGM